MKRMVDEKDRKKLSELTEADIEKLQGLHLYHYVVAIENTDDNYYGIVEFDSITNYTEDLSLNELYNEVQNKQIIITPGSEYSNEGYGYLEKGENHQITGYFSSGSDECDLASDTMNYNITIIDKKQIF